jgi:molecular chaperone HtpG
MGAGQSAPILSLSPMEAYILAAAAYLHDSGMVISDDGKAKILESEEWKAWTTADGNGAQRQEEIAKFRNGTSPADPSLRHFLADIQTRFLIAEFVRRVHHLRAKDILSKNEDYLGRFAFHNPALLRVIGDVCVAHGLSQRDLEDRERYPDRRDIDGQEVNVQFLAVILRLGDLLDMSHDRACPLLLSAACPLPAESLAHWTQYDCITHRLTAPDRIEMTAECRNQEEHRFLADWCQWLVDEVRNANILVARGHRHQNWVPPVVSLEAPDCTIHIRPAASAKYLPSRWKFELDTEAVFNRLITDIYEEPMVFLRELIQNALDATRCQLYLELKNSESEIPEFPTQAPEELRQKYPVRVSMEERYVKNNLSGKDELRQVVIVEDRGLGMDRDVIHRYLLQVGRSFYTTYEFQRKFSFIPTSRFGIGFLSVFGVSDRVTVDTYKPTSASQDGPLRIVLTGPRNYLLIEKGHSRPTGTRIEILLRGPMEKDKLTKQVSQWCKRVEFPVLLDDLGVSSEIRAENQSDFVYEIPVVTEPEAKFILRAFPINRHGLEGELYVLEYRKGEEERWDMVNWAQYEYPQSNPEALKPSVPEGIYCVHGISVSAPYSMVFHYRIDFRDGSFVPTLSRESRRMIWYMEEEEDLDKRIVSRWEEILNHHLQTAPRALRLGWLYKQALVDIFPFKAFWARMPGTVAFQTSEGQSISSLQDALRWAHFKTVTYPRQNWWTQGSVAEQKEIVLQDAVPVLTAAELGGLSFSHRRQLFLRREIDQVHWLSDGRVMLSWYSGETVKFDSDSGKPFYFVRLGIPRIVGFLIDRTENGTYYALLLNLDNDFASWVRRVMISCKNGEYGLKWEQFNQLFGYVYNCVSHHQIPEIEAYLVGWQKIANLPPELRPPLGSINTTSFQATQEEISKLSKAVYP